MTAFHWVSRCSPARRERRYATGFRSMRPNAARLHADFMAGNDVNTGLLPNLVGSNHTAGSLRFRKRIGGGGDRENGSQCGVSLREPH